MFLFSHSCKQASLLLLLLLSLGHNVVGSDLERRQGAVACCIGSSCDDDDSGNESPTLDGPTSDNSAGIGVEFETTNVRFGATCDLASTNACKGKLVIGRSGTNWQLTPDTTFLEAGLLSAEYILNGKTIKIGSGAAVIAATEVAADIIAWNPSADMANNNFDIQDSTCNPWAIVEPETGGEADEFSWAPQVTAPLPLEAISDLFAKAVSLQPSPLLPTMRLMNMISVTSAFFQSNPNGITSQSVTADVLGFFSLILSYAKAARTEDVDASLKEMTSIMPRTEFTTIFAQVSSKLPSTPGALYNILKVLGCYSNSGNTVAIDPKFCTAGSTVGAPVPNTQMDQQTFTVSWTLADGESTESKSLTVEEWIESIQAGTAPDALTTLDENIDGQIGGLGTALENVLNSNPPRAVPLFEFRRLPGVLSGGMATMVNVAEQAIITYHQTYSVAPSRMARRRRDPQWHVETTCAPEPSQISSTPDTPSSSPLITSSTPTSTQSSASPLITAAPPLCTFQNEDPDQGIIAMGCVCGTTTLPLLTVAAATDISQSCSYTVLPTSTVSNPIVIETQFWTTNCQACTLVGGVADSPTCTAVSGCTPAAAAPDPSATFVVWLSNNSVSVGNAANANNGTDLGDEAYSKLSALCEPTATECSSTEHAIISNIPTVVDGEVAYGLLNFTIQSSAYENSTMLYRMLSAAVASWEVATSRSCQNVSYTTPKNQDYTDCQAGPVKRDLPALEDLEKREECEEGCPTREEFCDYEANLCTGPNLINPVYAGSQGPYTNHMDITINFELEKGSSAFATFLCEWIGDTLTALAMEYAPELADLEIWEDIDFQSACESGVDDLIGLKRDLGNETAYLLEAS